MTSVEQELINAAEEGNLEGVKNALEQGAAINYQEPNFQDSALHIAASKGFLEIVQLLVEYDADMLLLNVIDMTPIHLAVRDGHVRIIEFLLSSVKKIPTRLLNDIITVGQMSVSSSDRIVEMLMKYRAKTAEPSTDDLDDKDASLLLASHGGKIKLVKSALEDGANIEVVDGKGMTPLLWASLRGCTEVVKVLLENGAEVNKANRAGWTPVIQAAASGHLDTLQVLIDHGGDVNQSTGYSETALMFAAGEGHLAIIELLLEHGAKPNLRNDDGLDALNFARRSGHDHVFAILQKVLGDSSSGGGLHQ